MEAAVEKRTLVVLAADLDTTTELIQLINEVGPHIAALKTLGEMVEDYSKESWQQVVDAAHAHGLLLFEDLSLIHI